MISSGRIFRVIAQKTLRNEFLRGLNPYKQLNLMPLVKNQQRLTFIIENKIFPHYDSPKLANRPLSLEPLGC
jgi:hypothetical protein